MRLQRADVPPIYALTPAVAPEELDPIVGSLVDGGIRWIQLRVKGVADAAFYEAARRLRTIARDSVLFINDRTDIALAAEADGVHLGDTDLPSAAARRFVPSSFLIGVSTHSAAEALSVASREEVDYVAIGPIFRSPTKNVREPLGLETIGRIRSGTDKPIVAIGGIDHGNVGAVIGAGADSAAILSALYVSGSPAEQARRLVSAVRS